MTSSREFARGNARTGLGREPTDAVPARSPDRNGNPVPTALRAEFERQFDADFSAVRLHTDDEGGAAALALGARAYTLGTDVTFAPGQYSPDTEAGRSLLAHELCHVAQDGGRRPASGEPIRIDPPGSAQEREADRAAYLLPESSGGGAPPPGTATRSSGPPLLHRSLFGTILGGVLGAGAGAVGGALLGGGCSAP